MGLSTSPRPEAARGQAEGGHTGPTAHPRPQGLARGVKPPVWHSQAWKGVRSGRERVFLRIGNDFSISSFKIIFPKLEVTWGGRKGDGSKTLILVSCLQKVQSWAHCRQEGTGSPVAELCPGTHGAYPAGLTHCRPGLGRPREQGVRAARGHSTPVASIPGHGAQSTSPCYCEWPLRDSQHRLSCPGAQRPAVSLHLFP